MRRVPATVQFTKQPYIEDVGPRRIESIRFSLFSESEILKAAEVEVHRGVYYDPSKKPIPNGLLDPHMGPPNKNGFCETCHGNFRECPGHYGYLTLTLPVYNVGYLSTVIDILKCICKHCSRILLGEKERQDILRKMRNLKIEPLKKSELMKRVVKRCTAMTTGNKSVKCCRCGYINGQVKKAPLGITHVKDSIIDECRSAISHTKELKGSVSIHAGLDPRVVHFLFKNMLDEKLNSRSLCTKLKERVETTNSFTTNVWIRMD